MKRLNVRLSASPAWVLKNVNRLAPWASVSIASILPRNRRASTLTCTRKSEREEIGARGDPSRAGERETSTRHDHMHVRMMGERRAPRVQHGGDTDPRTEALWISSDGERRLGRCLHQQ